MITIEYNGTRDALKAAVAEVNQLFTCIPFLDGVSKLKKFDLANITPQKIIHMIQETDLKLSLDLYWPQPFSSRAYAYDDTHADPVIHMNRLTLDRPIHSLCNTIMHQAVHALNTVHQDVYFGHGNNNPEGKEHTAPYFLAGLAQQLIADDEVVCDTMPHEDDANIPLIEQKDTQAIQQELMNEGLFCIYDHISVLQA